MKTTIRAAVLLLTLAFTGISQVVLAHDLADDCSAEIDSVRSALNDVADPAGVDGFCWDDLVRHKFGTKICDGLNKKLDDGDKKMSQHKIEDAVKKLAGFRKTLDSLAFRRKPIIDMAEYTSVSDQLVAAEACVAGQL